MPQIHFNTLSNLPEHIYFWKLDESCEELARTIDNGDVFLAEASSRFKSGKRQREWLATRALLQCTPYRGTGIMYHSCGQPHLGRNDKFISISHTNGYVAIAIADAPIGIDIESNERNAHAVASAFLLPEEIDRLAIGNTPAEEALRMWTAKEAAFKLAPGRSEVLKDILVTPKDNYGHTHIYSITYRDGGTATCCTAEAEGLLVSVAQFILP